MPQGFPRISPEIGKPLGLGTDGGPSVTVYDSHMCRMSRSTAICAIDAIFTGVVLAVLLIGVALFPGGPRTAVGIAVALGLAVVQGGSLLWARRYPERVMVLAIATGIGLEILCPHLGWFGLAGAPLSYLARLRPPRVSFWGLGVLVLASPWKFFTGGWRDMLLVITGSALAWALGELGRSSSIRRETERRRIVGEERARIARELHDVVAHNVSVIVVQAGAAEDVFDARPERAREALGDIQVVARTALAELRTLLETLRSDDEDDATAPQPGLQQLDALADSLRAAGLRVVLRREGSGSPLPAGVDLSAYRIVQESLTNTLRHAQATRADVTVRYDREGLSLVHR